MAKKKRKKRKKPRGEDEEVPAKKKRKYKKRKPANGRKKGKRGRKAKEVAVVVSFTDGGNHVFTTPKRAFEDTVKKELSGYEPESVKDIRAFGNEIPVRIRYGFSLV